MSKKAGPKRIKPETFVPAVWIADSDGTAFLVCQKRHCRLRPVTGSRTDKDVVSAAEWQIHGAASRMPPDLEILLGLRLNKGTWRPTNPLDFGISKRCAQVALAGAWHGVNLTIDSATMTAHLGGDGKAWLKHKNGVRERNIIVECAWFIASGVASTMRTPGL